MADNNSLKKQGESPQTFDLSGYIVDQEIVRIIPEDFARKYNIMPVFIVEHDLIIAMADPSNSSVIDEIQRMIKVKIEPVLADELDIRKYQDMYYGGTGGSFEEIIAAIGKGKLAKAENSEESASVVKIVNYLIIQAIQMKASDIHVEPEEKSLNVRYRIDGMLHRRTSLPKDLSGAVLSRLKVLSGLDITEKHLPQEGRILMKVGAQNIDFHVSSCPTVNGENIVMRMLGKNGITLGLSSLGFPPKEFTLFKDIISSPYGIVLVTGPTGSGKTATLYSALQVLNKEDVNIMTVEDPVEYQFAGMRQVQVDPKTGMTFAMALRSFLRQDPDIIMVGEIRDKETAEIAIQAALTGHMVFSTLHTNDSAASFTRLVDMGIEPFLVSSSILGILTQRLVRRVCEKCREMYVPSDEVIRDLGLDQEKVKGIKFAKGKGCKFCSESGYKDRVGIYELLKVTPAIQDLILKRASAEEIRAVALKEGLTPLRHAVIDKLLSGLTSVEEVFRVALDAE